MKVLVTGGAGFIGSNIVDVYVRAGHRVWVVDNESSGKRAQVNKAAGYTKADITDRARLATLFSRQKFDVVNHHAAQIDVRRSVADPEFDARTNILGTINLLTLAQKNDVKKFIFSSSGGTIYGECTRPATEKDEERPVSPYGVAKLAGEKYIKAFSALYGLKFTIFRYANVYGPRQDPFGEAGVVAIFSEQLIHGKPSFIYGTGKQTRDFVFVGDVAKANLIALTRGHNNVFNIGNGTEISVTGLYKKMSSIVPPSKPVVYKKARAGELQRSVLNIAKTKRQLGWTPAHTLLSGLEKTIRFFEREYSKRS